MTNRYRTFPGQMLALALLLAFTAREVSAQAPDFGSPLSYTAQKAPLAIAAADFNGDGAMDLAVANAESQTISIFLGSGVGTFSAAPTITLPSGCQAAYLTSGDFTGAAGPDLLAVCALGPIVVVPNTGHGTFGVPIVTTLPAPAWVGNLMFGYVHPAIADFNGDGHLDVAVPTFDDTSKVTGWYLLLGAGNGQFQPPSALPFTGTLVPPWWPAISMAMESRIWPRPSTQRAHWPFSSPPATATGRSQLPWPIHFRRPADRRSRRQTSTATASSTS